MNDKKIYWMNYSIDISKQASNQTLRVGAVLVSEKDEMICSAFSNEEKGELWSIILLRKVWEGKITNAQSIFVTINTLSTESSFDLNEVLKEVCIKEIYVGLPEPRLTSYLENDPVIIFDNVYRYPDKLKCKIMEHNMCFFTNSMQNIKHSSYYSENRISTLFVKNLKSKGFDISKDEVNKNKKKGAVASIICKRYELGDEEAFDVVSKAISEAFNSKYGTYSYLEDARSIDLNWKENFMTIYNRSFTGNLSNVNIVDVGVGSGQEALSLFFNCEHITFIDIARLGLENLKKHIPSSQVIVASADDLSMIPDNSYDLYVSLRTYNSSFFSIKEALLEAQRVLKSQALIIISVANGFLCTEQQCIIPGLIISGTEFVDLYRGLDTIRLIQKELLEIGFKNINLLPTNTEIYLAAIAI